MVKNLWGKVEVWCMNHQKPVKMYVYEGSNSPFYACPKYMLADEEHPGGHSRNEPGCANRASFEAVRKFVERLGELIEEAQANNEIVDFGGLKMHWRTIDAEILEYADDRIMIGVLNRAEINSWH